MNHTEHNEAVHARLNEILLDKVALALPKQTGNQHAHTKEMLMAKSEIDQEYRMAADRPILNIQPGIAEAFVQFAKDQEFNFWRE